MRITFVLPYASLNGGNRVIATYALELIAQGHDVCVVSEPAKAVSAIRQLKKRLVGRGHQIRDKPTHPLFDTLGKRHKVIDRPRSVTADDVPDADVLVATWWRTAPAVAALPASKGRKFYLLQDYETFVDHLPDNPVAATYTLPMAKIAVSDYIRDQLATHHEVHDVSVVPNSVDMTQFDAPPRDKNTPLRLGFLYNTHPRKRVELTIAALQLAKQRLPKIEAVAFGAESRQKALPGWVDYHKTPAQSDLAGLYASCDLWLFSSLSEGFGLPLLEAMACRTPVLATRAGAAEHIVTGQNGKLMEASPEAFAAEIGIFSAMSQPEWRSYSDAAYDTVRGYSWGDATRALLEVFRAADPSDPPAKHV